MWYLPNFFAQIKVMCRLDEELMKLLGRLDKLLDCLLYTSDAADERSSVDLGGRRIIKKQNQVPLRSDALSDQQTDSRFVMRDSAL